MPKLLIIDTCIVDHGDDRGGVAVEFGSITTPPKDVASALVSAGRALYVNKKDDANKDGRYTASEAMLAAAKKAQRAKKSDDGADDMDESGESGESGDQNPAGPGS